MRLSEGTVIKLQDLFAIAILAAFLVTPTLAGDRNGGSTAIVSEDLEPILGAAGAAGEPIAGVVIDDGPDPFGHGVISDTPDPISGALIEDPGSVACIVDGPEPIGASNDNDPDVIQSAFCRIGRTVVVVLWMAQ